MTVLEAAARVLSELGHPLHIRELTTLMLSKGYWQTQGLTPEATVQACLAVDIKTKGEASPFIRSKPGHFGLKGQSVAESSQTQPGEARPLFEEEEEDEADATETQPVLSFTDAAERLLQEVGKPLHYRDITRIIQEKGWISTRGKTPEATMYAQILTEIGRYEKRKMAPRFQKLGHGQVGLAIWGSNGNTPIELPWTTEDEKRLAQLKAITPVQFEKFTALLLTQVFDAEILETPRSNDAGIDARGKVRLQDLIEFELVAQAKQFNGHNVRRPDIQRLRGSMGPQAIGVFITTEDFSLGAKNEAHRESAMHPIGLINGRMLVELLKGTTIEITPSGEAILLDGNENLLALSAPEPQSIAYLQQASEPGISPVKPAKLEKPEIVLKVGTEGGSLTLLSAKVFAWNDASRKAGRFEVHNWPDGKERERTWVQDVVFWVEWDERTLAAFFDEADLPDELCAKTDFRESFDEALHAFMDKYQWWRLYPVQIHPWWKKSLANELEQRFPGWQTDPTSYAKDWYECQEWHLRLDAVTP